jgi:integrase
MGLDIEEELIKVNSRLKSSGTRVTIERRGNSLLLRGTFPPKPGCSKAKPYQQRLFLGLKASATGLRAAEQKAKIISGQLELKAFNWGDWVEPSEKESTTLSIGEWLEKFESDRWSSISKNRKSLRTWNDSYLRAFNKLESLTAPLTLDGIIQAILKTQPDTKTRQTVCHAFAKLAKFAEIEGVEKILQLSGNYSPTSVSPRNLPSDEVIASVINLTKHLGWRWLLGMLATYGLRSHECFELDLSEFPIIRVLEDTKTGERIVYPLYPEWVEWWDLGNLVYPPIKQTYNCDQTPGQRIARWIWKQKLPFRAYDLRHCYARRCFEFDIPTNRAAKLMGHSETIHSKVYRAWIDEKYYRSKFNLDVFGEGKPRSPLPTRLDI